MKRSYYLKGEEKFGPIMSPLYDLVSCRSPTSGVYGIVMNDVIKSDAKRVLDIGTGPGRIPGSIARMKNIEVYAVDPSKQMIEIAKKNASGLRNVHFSLGSSRDVPFKGKFDIIFSSISMHHWIGKEDSLRYLSKLLSKNGEIRIYEFNKKYATGIRWLMKKHSMSKEEFYTIADATSLRVKRVFEKGKYIVAVYTP